MFLVNSRLGLFVATSSRFSGCKQPDTTLTRHPFSRSYGANLPSSLTRVLSSALAFSASLPVSVCGTVTRIYRLEVFLGRKDQPLPPHKWETPSQLGLDDLRICLKVTLTAWTWTINPMQAYLSTSPHRLSSAQGGAGILTGYPSPTPFGLGLGPTNPGWTSLPQETLGFRRKGFSPLSRVLMPASSLPRRPGTSRFPFNLPWNAPLPSQILWLVLGY